MPSQGRGDLDVKEPGISNRFFASGLKVRPERAWELE